MSETTHRPPSDAEDALHRAEALLAETEARKVAAEAIKAEADAEIARFKLAAEIEKEQDRLHDDEHHRVYRFSDSVSDTTADKCISRLRRWHRLDPECEIEVIFDSPGGSVIAGMGLFDELTRLSTRGGGTHHVTTGVQGFAASMAGILLQAGDTRWIGNQSYLMIHEISAGAGGKIGEIEDSVKFYNAICDRVVKIFVDRSGGKITKRAFIAKWKRQDWWMLADDAVKYGFVDEIR